MVKQMPREDLFTPIHKAIRSMIYELGSKLQKTDFTDVSATDVIITELKHNLKSANYTCIICMLHEHGEHEDQWIFPQLSQYDSDVVDAMIQEHAETTRQIVEISRLSDDLVQLEDNAQRIEAGIRLNTVVNKLLAFYLTHLNNEEATILPLTWKYLTDDEIRAIRTKIQMAIPPERYGEQMRWIVLSLNVNELVEIFSGMKKATPPSVWKMIMHLAEQNLDPHIWNKVKTKANL